MELVEMSSEEYAESFKDSWLCYGDHQFIELNAEKCEKVHYLCARNKRFRMGIIGGRIGLMFAVPFSAPFGGFVFPDDHMHMNYVDEAILLFLDWIKNQGLNKIKIALPPLIYDEAAVSKVTNSLLRAGFTVDSLDLNYYLSLDKFGENYDSVMRYNARKNLKKALDHNLCFFLLPERR